MNKTEIYSYRALGTWITALACNFNRIAGASAFVLDTSVTNTQITKIIEEVTA